MMKLRGGGATSRLNAALLFSLPTPPPQGWERVRLEKMLLKPKLNDIKIPKNNFLDKGNYPIISQENGIINGWTNLENPIIDLPLIVFGDHSCSLKFVDFPFFRGADGTQILKFKNKLNTKLAFYILKESEIPNKEKYERHFKYLKAIKIPLPPLEAQESIVQAIESVENEIAKLKEQSKTFESKKAEILKSFL